MTKIHSCDNTAGWEFSGGTPTIVTDCKEGIGSLLVTNVAGVWNSYAELIPSIKDFSGSQNMSLWVKAAHSTIPLRIALFTTDANYSYITLPSVPAGWTLLTIPFSSLTPGGTGVNLSAVNWIQFTYQTNAVASQIWYDDIEVPAIGGPSVPVVTASCNPTSVQVGQYIAFNALVTSGGTPPFSYQWLYNSDKTPVPGFPATSNPSVTYGAPITITVICRVTDSLSNTGDSPVVTATWTPITQQYTLTIGVSPSGGGTTSPTTSSYNAGTIVPVTAYVASGYIFDHWELDGVGQGNANPLSVTVDANKTLTAVFVSIPPPTTVDSWSIRGITVFPYWGPYSYLTYTTATLNLLKQLYPTATHVDTRVFCRQDPTNPNKVVWDETAEGGSFSKAELQIFLNEAQKRGLHGYVWCIAYTSYFPNPVTDYGQLLASLGDWAVEVATWIRTVNDGFGWNAIDMINICPEYAFLSPSYDDGTYTSIWNSTIARIRAANPDILICTGINWDPAFSSSSRWNVMLGNSGNPPEWLANVDIIGIDAWFGLTASTTPTVAQLVSCWTSTACTGAYGYETGMNLVTHIQQLTAKWGRRVILNLGYPSFDGGNNRPYLSGIGTYDAQEQADCWQAAFQVWSTQDIAGFSMEQFDLQEHTISSNLTQDWRGKPAQTIIATWLATIQPPLPTLTIDAQQEDGTPINVPFPLTINGTTTNETTPFGPLEYAVGTTYSVTAPLTVGNMNWQRWGDGVTSQTRSGTLITTLPLTMIYSVTALLPPVANFTFLPTSPTVGQTVTFDASGSYPQESGASITNYNWSFGDGSNPTDTAATTITHAYSATGTYNVVLTVRDSNGLFGIKTSQIVVSTPPPPVVNIAPVGPLDKMPGSSQGFTANVTGGQGTSTVTWYNNEGDNYGTGSTKAIIFPDRGQDYIITIYAVAIDQASQTSLPSNMVQVNVTTPPVYQLVATVTPTPVIIKPGEISIITVYVTANSQPIEGAAVSMIASGGTLLPTSGTTGADGIWTTNFTDAILENVTIDASVSKAGYTDGTGSGAVNVTVLTPTPSGFPWWTIGVVGAVAIGGLALAARARHKKR